jgi:formate hydrogenlyase subunit 3/multisubunit Na+/H+ antiporter MnhD subunit
MLPVVGALLSFLLGGRWSARIALLSMPLGVGLAAAIAASLLRSGAPLVYILGAWEPPLGIALRADGLATALLLITTLILTATTLYAWRDFATPPGAPESRRAVGFWTLLLGVWAGLNAMFLSNDLFSLFVAVELLTFSAVPLTSLDGRASTAAAALRYLLFSLLGSMLYLLGVALIYGAFGVLDITLLAGRVAESPAGLAGLSLMTVGLMAKSALFPFHLWLPPAHAGAPPAASAVLSALVIKGPFVLAARLWFDLVPQLLGGPATQCIAALGAAAILFGSVMAVRQERLKLLVAYSTVAQIGYLFLAFALAGSGVSAAGAAPAASTAVVTGATLQAISHAFAKAAMFMAAGMVARGLGHDRIADLGGIGRTLPLTLLTLAIAGLSLMGVPPSGGFWAKWLLLTAAIETGQWWWALVILSGGLLAGGYVLRIVSPALAASGEGRAEGVRQRVSRLGELAALALAITSLLMGLLAVAAIELVQIGRTGAPEGITP